MSSSDRFEDLKSDLLNTQDKIKLQMSHNMNEVTLNKLCSEGDVLVNMLKKEVDNAPYFIKHELQAQFQEAISNWNSFKSSSRSQMLAFRDVDDVQVNLNRGIDILERTGQSLSRAEMMARETEDIGGETINELGEQREALLRARERLDTTASDLKRTHRILKTINRRVLTNKCLLIGVIILEIFILLAVIYIRWIRKK